MRIEFVQRAIMSFLMKYALKLNIIKRTNLIKKNIESETESRTENASGDGG